MRGPASASCPPAQADVRKLLRHGYDPQQRHHASVRAHLWDARCFHQAHEDMAILVTTERTRPHSPCTYNPAV